MRNKAEQDTSRLEGRVRELEDSLRTYAALEGELDDVIMQAAEAEDADQVRSRERGGVLEDDFGTKGPGRAAQRLDLNLQ